MSGYSANDLLSFLDYALDKGLGKRETLKTRIVSVRRIVDVVGAEEFGDLREVDVDHIMERFTNLEGTKFSPGSLASYRSRLNSSISDFLRYKENPTSYRPKGQRTSRTKANGNDQGTSSQQGVSVGGNGRSASEHRRQDNYPDDPTAFPIPLRRDLTVKIVGLPHDLTQNEAQRIANIVIAMAILEE